MEKFIKFVYENKSFVIFFLIWSFIHSILLINGENGYGFWPFGGFDIFQCNSCYGGVEFFVYEVSPLLAFAIIKLAKKDINENNEEGE